jgi:uncharacterized damage-inducible protein DinB
VKTQSEVLGEVLLETYAVSDAMNQLLLVHLDRRAWRARLPGRKAEGRTIAQIFAHPHNCRLVWLRESAPHLKRPSPLDPLRCTMRETAALHKKSAALCLRMLSDALLTRPVHSVTRFSRGAWTRPWPAGASLFAYIFSHEAHHRGQTLQLAHQVGYRLPATAWGRIWNWDKLWKDHGFVSCPR